MLRTLTDIHLKGSDAEVLTTLDEEWDHFARVRRHAFPCGQAVWLAESLSR